MPQATGKTYGFGRVSTETRPSPYTPVHLSSVAPRIVATAEGSADLGRARRRRRLAGLLTVAAVAVASALAAAGFLRALSRTSADLRDPDGTHATLVALDDEAERLVRSAIVASHRGARP